MSVIASYFQRLAARLIRHASRVMPHKHSTWADAMRSEFEHTKDQPGALVWAFGCIFASYKCRVTELYARHAHQMLTGIAACGLAALLAGYAIAGQASGQTPPKPTFADTPCDLPHSSPEIRPRLRCGTVSVPRDYEHPEAGTFKLAVVIIRSERQPALPDPIVYISGGPGSPLTVYASAQATHSFAPDRDLILVDQRGMGRSEPNICPDHNKGLAIALATILIEPTADMQAIPRAAFMACRDEARANGIDLRDFGTTVTVQDFDTVRQALGITEWNIFGVSYGTTVAMTLMVRYPETIRSAVLDSVYPPDPDPPLRSIGIADARDAFFAACDKDAACAVVYPDLAGLYRETIARLDRSPLAMILPPDLRDPSHPGRLTAPWFEFVVGHLVWYPNFYPGLPRLIASVHDGDTTLFSATAATLFAEATNPDTGTNLAASAAVECRDRPRFRQKLPDNANILDRTALYGVCDGWESLGPPPIIPTGTKVPTLILSGQFDPNAKPALSRHVADLIGSHARWVEFLLAGHSVRASSPCASGIVAEFVDHPVQTVETTCAALPPPIRFLPIHQAP